MTSRVGERDAHQFIVGTHSLREKNEVGLPLNCMCVNVRASKQDFCEWALIEGTVDIEYLQLRFSFGLRIFLLFKFLCVRSMSSNIRRRRRMSSA